MGRLLRFTLYALFLAFVLFLISVSRWLFLGGVSETEESIMETVGMHPKVKRFNESILASEGERLEPMRRPRFPRSPRGDIYFEDEEIIILLFVPFFGDFFPGYRTVENCPVKCKETTDRRAMKRAHGVYFHLPGYQNRLLPSRAFPEQLFISHTMESDALYPKQADPEYMKDFDVIASYRLDSHIPSLYASRAQYNFEKPVAAKDKLLGAFVTNKEALNNRTNYLGDLLSLLPPDSADSFGAVHRNRILVADEKRTAKWKVLPRYRFTFSMESSDSTDYVTEKYFQALESGSVPLYWGAPNIADFSPEKNLTFIDMKKFKSPKNLADFIISLDKDEERYQSYLKWKQKPFSPKFKSFLDISEVSTMCRVCMRLAGVIPKGVAIQL